MKQLWKEIGIAILMGMVLPGILLNLAVAVRDPSEPTAPTVQPEAESAKPVTVSVLTEDGTVEEMELDDYITGVVLAEMPASFEDEALKAQSVVARTYTLRAHRGKSKHADASVCTDSNCCQGYRSRERYLAEGGTAENFTKVEKIVYDTSGYVLTYDGELIEATYFSSSGGRTEDAVAVWGADVPYLRSVDSPGEEEAAHYRDRIRFSVAEIEEYLDISLPSDSGSWFTEMTYTAGGGVAEIKVGGKLFRGTELRKLLGLRSTAFTVTADAEGVTFETRGYGHRVGMSQYGADAMALEGSTYRQILEHYYPGTVLEYCTD